jgi:hypothetical protein
MLNIVILSVAQCHFMLHFLIVSLSVIILGVVMPNVLAPKVGVGCCKASQDAFMAALITIALRPIVMAPRQSAKRHSA